MKQRKRLESSIEESCRVFAKGLGWESRKMNGLGFRSWPDRFFLPPKGRVRFWCEFKREGEVPTIAQANMHKDLRKRGETVVVFDNVAGFKAFLRKRNARC